MRIDKNYLNEEIAHIHDAHFTGFYYDVAAQTINMKLAEDYTGKSYSVFFSDVQLFEMQSCEFWAPADRVYYWENVRGESDNTFASSLFRGCVSQPFDLEENVESVLSLVSGDTLTVVSRFIDFEDEFKDFQRRKHAVWTECSKKTKISSLPLVGCIIIGIEYDYFSRFTALFCENPDTHQVYQLKFCNTLFSSSQNKNRKSDKKRIVDVGFLKDSVSLKQLQKFQAKKQAEGKSDFSPYLQADSELLQIQVEASDETFYFLCTAIKFGTADREKV